MPDYVSLSNYYGSPKPPTKAQEKLIKELEDMNLEARNHNSRKQNEKVIKGPIKRYCPLDEAPLKPIKDKVLEDLNIPLPRYRCSLCKSVFQGYGLNLYHETKKNLKAICFEMDGTI